MLLLSTTSILVMAAMMQGGDDQIGRECLGATRPSVVRSSGPVE